PTQVSVVAPSLAVPWQQYTLAPDGVTELQRNQDSVDVYAFNADAYASAGPADDDPNVPADQAKSFAGWTFDWSFVVNATNRGDGVRPLLDAGDDPILTHLVSTIVEDPALPSSDPWSSWTLATAADSGVIAPVTMADGSPAKLEATLTSGPSKSFALDLRGSAFAAEVTANGPAVVSSAALSFGSTREPGAPNPIYGNAPTLFDAFTFGFNEPANPTCYPDDMGMCDAMACPTGCDATAVFHFPGDLTRTIQYTDPYEAHGQELFGAVLTVRSFVTHPTTKKRVRLLSALDVAAPAADVAGKPIEPRMGFVRGITLGGKSAPVAAPTPGMGTSFEVKWSAPALGTPNAYFVRVIQWADTELPDAVNASSVVLALLRTRETSFVLPDGILESGHYYSISVRADDWFDELRPNLYTSPTLSSAELSTGLFTP
ncbi:MAG: fibronectin type III domain-containing protein, partial [Polyangiaceae bacterium]